MKPGLYHDFCWLIDHLHTRHYLLLGTALTQISVSLTLNATVSTCRLVSWSGTPQNLVFFHSQHHAPTAINCPYTASEIKLGKKRLSCVICCAIIVIQNSKIVRLIGSLIGSLVLSPPSQFVINRRERDLSSDKVKHYRYCFRHRFGIHVGLACALWLRPTINILIREIFISQNKINLAFS